VPSVRIFLQDSVFLQDSGIRLFRRGSGFFRIKDFSLSGFFLFFLPGFILADFRRGRTWVP